MTWRVSPIRAIVLVLAVCVNAWLLLDVAGEFVSGDRSVADRAVWTPQLSSSSEKVPAAKPLDAYREILAHPIFFKSREPFVPAPPPPPPVVMAMPSPVGVDPELVLGGIMIKDGLRKAYVSRRASASGAWASEGDELSGWQIRSIDAAGARLEQNGRSIELQLYPRQ